MFYKSKSEIRTETEDAVALFLRNGGTIEICKPSKKGIKAGKTMKATSTRNRVIGGGKPMGYTRSSFG